LSAISIVRRYTSAVPAALNAETIVNDDRTSQPVSTLNQPNSILDALNDPDPATLDRVVRILKNDIDTGRQLFVNNMSSGSDGRQKIPAPGLLLEPGQIQYLSIQRSGALLAHSFVVTYRNGF